MSDCYIIYKTINLKNGKFYIGQHNTSANDGYLGSGKYLKRAIKKYGREIFIRETLEHCTSANVNEKEIFWINELSATKIGYNFDKGGSGGNKVVWTKEKRKQMSEKLSGENNPNFGKKHSDETKIKMSECKIGKNNPMFGVFKSEEEKRKFSEKRKGENNPFYGKHHNDDSREKIRKGNFGKKLNDFQLKTLKKYNESRSKKVQIDGNIFNSILEASNILKIDRKTITYRIKSKNFKNYFFIKKE